MAKKEVYKSASFDDSLKFGGANGLLNKYYSGYQLALKYPIIVEFSVKLSNYEITTLNMLQPVYIDGVYYMLIEAVVGTNNITRCKAIKMPPGFKPKL